MFKKIESKKTLFIVSVVSVLIFYLLANGYRLFSPMYSGDSLYMIHHNDSAWEIALGRFVHPFLVFLRGGIINPFLIGFICIFWLSLSAYFLVDFLEIDRIVSVVFIAAAMICNTTLLATNATFITYVDFYTFALFCSVFGVWLIKKEKFLLSVLGAIALSLSLGTYQSYICVSIALVMIHFLFKMMNRPTFKDTFKSAMRYLVSFASAAVIYYIIWKIFQKIFNIWTADTYNGLSAIGDYSETSIGTVIADTYKNVLNYFINPETFTTIPFRGVSMSIFWVYIIRFCNVTVLIMLVFAIVRLNIKYKTNLWHKLIQLLIIVLFPLGINFVCFISKGMEHTLMIYAFCLFYVLAAKAAESCFVDLPEIKIPRKPCIPWIVVLASIMIVSWSNIVYSNQVYLKKDLQEQAMMSLMTRIVYEIESTEGYVAGVTPVAFSGSFEQSPALSDMGAFNEILPYGMGKTSVIYVGPDYSFLTYYLNVNMNLTRISDEHEVIKQMPAYPAEGSIAYVDGILVVRIAE